MRRRISGETSAPNGASTPSMPHRRIATCDSAKPFSRPSTSNAGSFAGSPARRRSSVNCCSRPPMASFSWPMRISSAILDSSALLRSLSTSTWRSTSEMARPPCGWRSLTSESTSAWRSKKSGCAYSQSATRWSSSASGAASAGMAAAAESNAGQAGRWNPAGRRPRGSGRRRGRRDWRPRRGTGVLGGGTGVLGGGFGVLGGGLGDWTHLTLVVG